jgi:hypothetical protein
MLVNIMFDVKIHIIKYVSNVISLWHISFFTSCFIFYFILFYKSDHEGMTFVIFCLCSSSEVH